MFFRAPFPNFPIIAIKMQFIVTCFGKLCNILSKNYFSTDIGVFCQKKRTERTKPLETVALATVSSGWYLISTPADSHRWCGVFVWPSSGCTVFHSSF